MGEENKVVLHGIWASHFVKRVEIALKLKGIPFEFIEEDLSNKSPQLLNYNPVHKKVPVLVHNGKPVSESLIIVEYIDETWKNSPRFLPENPSERARVRFWADYIQKVLFQCMANIVNNEGEEQAKACEEFYEILRVLEDGVKDLFPGGDPSPQGRNVGLLDIVIVPTLGAYKAQEEVFGAKFVDPNKNPLIHSWLTSLLDLPVMKEIAPPHEKMVLLLQMLKQSGVKFSPDS